MIKRRFDVALLYGFETHTGFYKAFAREFGCIMVTHKKATSVLKKWGLENETISDIH